MIIISFFLVPILYAIIHTIDFCASFSRVAGFFLKRNSLGYSIQNSTVAYTRLFNMMMLPLIGYLIDENIPSANFYIMSLLSFLLCGTLSLISYFNSDKILNFFSKKLSSLIGDGHNHRKRYKSLIEKNADPRVFFMGLFVYTINGTSILLTFFLATFFAENKVMITQMSGVITAAATFVLTVKLDPMMSIKIEKNDSYVESHRLLLISRLTACWFSCPLLFTIAYLVLG